MIRPLGPYYPRTTTLLSVPIKNASWTPSYPPYDTHQLVLNPNDPSNSPNLSSLGNEPVNAGGASGLSETIDIGGSDFVEISTPSNWTTAVITIMACPIFGNDSLFNSLRNPDGTEFTITVSASQTVALPYMSLFSLDRFRLRSGTFAAPVQQATDSILQLKITQQIRI